MSDHSPSTATSAPAKRTFRIWRGDKNGGGFKSYQAEITTGMVVLDAVHQIQAADANDLSVRWNCKAGKCGSCSAEINGKPRLMCMTRMETLPPEGDVTIQPLKAFPNIRDLVTDVSWNFEQNKRITPLTAPPKGDPDLFADGTFRMYQHEVDRSQEFRKCIECFLCQDVCHVLREHDLHTEFIGPRFLVRAASLEMHPLDRADRTSFLKYQANIGYCNITKCCTEVCPEHIHITDNAIIPLKERVVDAYYDPVAKVIRWIFGAKKS